MVQIQIKSIFFDTLIYSISISFTISLELMVRTNLHLYYICALDEERIKHQKYDAITSDDKRNRKERIVYKLSVSIIFFFAKEKPL
jgi:hypothetical protein